MDKIKSAWEIAEEKTRGITVDQEALKRRENADKGKRIISQFLEDPEKVSLAAEIKKLSTDAAGQVKQGMCETLLANLALPLTEYTETRNARARDGLMLLSPEVKTLPQLLDQVMSFLTTYTSERAQLEKSLEEQYAPRLRQKAQAIAKQTGASVELYAMQDPEFVALLKKNLSLFDERYQEALKEAKTEIERLVRAG